MTATDPTIPRAVLAYGTLRPGEGNHEVVSFLRPTATTVTVPGWGLYAADGYPFPFAWPTPGAEMTADLLAFHAADWPTALSQMDRLEGWPKFYGRQVVRAYTADAARTPVKGWLYVPVRDPRGQHALIPGGDWQARARARARAWA